MVERTAIIKNKQGMHCRPSTVIIKEAITMPGQITISTKDASCDCKSIMALLSLGLCPGAKVRIQVTGDNEEANCERLAALFEEEFDFPVDDD